MTWLLIGLAFFLGGFLGCLGMSLACAAKDSDDHWDAYERGYRDGVDHMAELNAVSVEWPEMSPN